MHCQNGVCEYYIYFKQICGINSELYIVCVLLFFFFIFFAVRLHAKSERRYKQFSMLYQSLKYPALFLVSIVYSEEKVRSVAINSKMENFPDFFI